jgi:hypothetical protein
MARDKATDKHEVSIACCCIAEVSRAEVLRAEVSRTGYCVAKSGHLALACS